MDHTSKSRPRSLVWIAVIGLALGVAMSATLRLLAPPEPSYLTIDDLGPSAPIDPSAFEVQHDSVGPASPQAAVVAFLEAVKAADAGASFDLLSLDDRNRYRSPGAWNNALVTMFGPVESSSIMSAGSGSIETSLTLESSLSDVAGLIPRTMIVHWATVDEAGYRIELSNSTAEPLYPSDDAIAESARRWIENGASCEAKSDPWLGSSTETHDQICADVDRLALLSSDHQPSPQITARLTARFGPDAAMWSRTVTFDGPVLGHLVLAPIGDEWVVVDALPDPLS